MRVAWPGPGHAENQIPAAHNSKPRFGSCSFGNERFREGRSRASCPARHLCILQVAGAGSSLNRRERFRTASKASDPSLARARHRDKVRPKAEKVAWAMCQVKSSHPDHFSNTDQSLTLFDNTLSGLREPQVREANFIKSELTYFPLSTSLSRLSTIWAEHEEMGRN